MNSAQLQPNHVGHVWVAKKAIQPCLLSVMRSIRAAGYSHRFLSKAWLLDYSFTPFGRYKVGSVKTGWKDRPAFEAHLYPPRTLFFEDTGAAGVSQTNGIFICFSGGEVALDQSLTRHACVRFLDPNRRLGPLLERMLRFGMGMGAAGFAGAQAVLWEIMALLNASSRRDRDVRVIPAEDTAPVMSDFIQTVQEYLSKHLTERITREDLARHLNLSVSALAHRYYKETGEAPMSTLIRMRIHVAKSLLLKGALLKTIAMQTGFCDEYHLSRTFKRMVGVSARDFRRRQLCQPARTN